MISENILLSLRAPSADEGAEDSNVSSRHSRFRDASFTAGINTVHAIEKAGFRRR